MWVIARLLVLGLVGSNIICMYNIIYMTATGGAKKHT